MRAPLASLEAEAIHIIREAAAEAERPVMLFSGGKDSCVMLHLARKAFFPAQPPFPLLHVDTAEVRRALRARDELAAEAGMSCRLRNPEASEGHQPVRARRLAQPTLDRGREALDRAASTWPSAVPAAMRI